MKGVIEILDREGQVRSVCKVGEWPARIGRSPGCDIVLDDSHLAGEHAELQLNEAGAAQLVLLPSINGGWLGDHKLTLGEAAPLEGHALFQLGATHLRWRSADAPLPAEKPLEVHQLRQVARSVWWLPFLLTVWLFTLGFDFWLASENDTKLVTYAWPILSPLAAVLAWAGAWALVTQLFQRRFPFGKHLRRVLTWLLVMEAIDYALPGLAYSFGVPRLAAVFELLMPAAAVFLIWWHASLVWPRARRSFGIGLCILLMLGLGLRLAQRGDEQYAYGSRYLSVLPPPALRLVKPKPPEALLDDLRSLRGPLDQAARKDNDTPAPEEDE